MSKKSFNIFFKSGKYFFGAFLFLVQKVKNNYDLNPKFEQKNFKNEDRNSNSISMGKMAKTRIMKKENLIHPKYHEGYYPTEYRLNMYLKSGKNVFFKTREMLEFFFSLSSCKISRK